jgi:glycosyltransferase involved in cell wall biosynthesis/predicted O-methyltransferase YrrM
MRVVVATRSTPVMISHIGRSLEARRMGEVLDAATRPQPSGRLFTVGIPVFNGKSLFRNCLQSVINSTLPRHRFEIVVADDGSTEPETLAILGEFEKSLAADPGFFRVISLGTNSGGAARPRNRILDEATGEYVFFLDSDDTIGNLTLERIAEALAATPADWVAVNQVAVNGRAAVCEVRHARAEVPRAKALTTLTVHKVFRREEIERQQLRFDEELPSGQDVTFAFSYILNAARFLMLGGYDYYYLTQHAGNPNEPAHLSRRANTPSALIEKNERILRSMLTAVRKSNVPESERRKIISDVVLPRVLIKQRYLKAIVNAGPNAGTQALQRLSELLADPPIVDLVPAKGMTGEHLAVIAKADWAELAQLVPPTGHARRPPHRVGLAARWARRGRRFVDVVSSGRGGHQQVVDELARLRRSVEDMGKAQHRLEANLQAEFQLRDMLAASESSGPQAPITPLNPGWQLSSQAMQEVVRHVLLDQPKVIVECGSGASTMWIGRALRQVGAGRLISLENSADWVAIVTGLLQHEGLTSVEVRHAPIEPIQIARHEHSWYSASAVADVEEIDLLLVDGPPGRTTKLARYPAVPALRDRLRPGATVMLDDCHRSDEKEALRKWLAEVPGLLLVRKVDHLAVMKIS